MKIVTTEQMRRAEEACAEIGLPTDVLMEKAGKAVAGDITRIVKAVTGERFLFLVGPGNNGGDGLVAARHLLDAGAAVDIYLVGARPPDDPNLKQGLERGATCLCAAADDGLRRLDELLARASVIIDAVFGTGKLRPLTGVFADALKKVNDFRQEHPGLRLVAVDLPSGLNADTGEVDPACPYADYTITLGFPKPGLFNLPGAAHTGRLSVVDIGIPAYLVKDADTDLITPAMARALLPRRPLLANKGSFGKALVVAGSVNYVGAAYLACYGAIRAGAGLVTLATPRSLQPIFAAKMTEVTYLPLDEAAPGIVAPGAVVTVADEAGRFDVMLLGCGLGQAEPAVEFVRTLLLEDIALPKLVLDADALNTLAGVPGWWNTLKVDAILTPHPGEVARLTGASIEQVQSDRIEMARRLAGEWHKTTVLKGAYTAIGSPDGHVRVSPAANPGLASAGTGDVLAGVIVGLVAQGLGLYDAATCGVYLHARAGEMVRGKLGDAGMIASDLLPVLPRAIHCLTHNMDIREYGDRPC